MASSDGLPEKADNSPASDTQSKAKTRSWPCGSKRMVGKRQSGELWTQSRAGNSMEGCQERSAGIMGSGVALSCLGKQGIKMIRVPFWMSLEFPNSLYVS